MLLSFVIPALNEEERIQSCLASIEAASNTSPVSIETIVVDNGSEDTTGAKARASGAKVVFEEKRGIPSARAAGFAASWGDLVAFVDADSILTPGWVGAAVANFEDPGVVAASGGLQFYDASAYVNTAARCFFTVQRIAHNAFPSLQGGNYVVRRSALLAVGGFDTSIEFWGEDTRTAIQLAGVGKIVLDPKMVMLTSSRRLTQAGLMRTSGKYVANYLSLHIAGRPLNRDYENWR